MQKPTQHHLPSCGRIFSDKRGDPSSWPIVLNRSDAPPPSNEPHSFPDKNTLTNREMPKVRTMQCPKCHANDQSASHDPWSGRSVIACKACGAFVEGELAERERAYAIVANVVASRLMGEHKGNALPVAREVLAAFDKAGLTIRRA